MTKKHTPPKKAFGLRRAEGSVKGAATPRCLTPGICICLAVMVFAVFGQTFGYGFFDYDDGQYVYANPHVTGGLNWTDIQWAFTHFHCNNWHPVTWISHMLDCQLYGLNAGAHHATNILFHAASVILLFLLLRYLTREVWPSAFVAAVFAIHPLRVESVAWISERKDVLSGFFFMLTLLAYTRYVKSMQAESLNAKPAGGNPRGTERLSSNAAFGFVVGRGWPFYWLTVLLFALGLMSKPMLVTLPFVLLLLDYWPLQRFGWAFPQTRIATIWRLIIEKIPFLCLSAASCVVTLRAQQATIAPVQWLPLSLRVENALASYVIYLRQMFYPANLAIMYPHAVVSPPLWQTALALLLLAAISGLVLMLRRKRRYLITGWLWYLGMLVPVIGLVQVGFQAHADRYTYLPQIGVYVALVWAMKDWTVSWRYRPQILSVVGAGIITVLAICAWKQTTYWRTSATLWRHAIACTSYNPIAEANLDVTLGHQLDLKGRYAEAIPLYVKALKIAPHFADSAYIAEAQYDLGTLYLRLNQRDKAREHLLQAVKFNPGLAEAYYNLGHLFATEGEIAKAIGEYQKAITARPDYMEAHYILALLLTRTGKLGDAIAEYRRTLELKPDFADAHNNLANLLVKQDHLSEAVAQYKKAIQLKPDYVAAQYNLGEVFGLQGKVAEAAAQYRKVTELDPESPDAHGNLANLLVVQGKLGDAIKEYQRTIELAPRSAQAYFRYGQALEKLGRFRDAVSQFQKALQIDSKHIPAHLSLAWLLATCPDASLRDGGKAVMLARQAQELAHVESAQLLDTLAASYAESGKFGKAIELMKRCLAMTAVKNDSLVTEVLQKRLKLYEANTPYHGSGPELPSKQSSNSELNR